MPISRQSGRVTPGEQIVLQREDGHASTLAMQGHTWLIGRDSDVDLQLGGAAVSRLHARVERHNDQWLVTDLDSTNGTYLDGVRLQPQQPVEWLPEAALVIGSYALHRADLTFTQEQTVYLTPEDALALEEERSALAGDELAPFDTTAQPAAFAFDVEEFTLNGDRINKLVMRATGDNAVTVTINGRSEQDNLVFRARSRRMMLIPGTLIEARVIISAQHKRLVGRAHELPYTIELLSDSGERQSYSSRLKVQPLVPLYLLVLIGLLLAGLLTVIVFGLPA